MEVIKVVVFGVLYPEDNNYILCLPIEDFTEKTWKEYNILKENFKDKPIIWTKTKKNQHLRNIEDEEVNKILSDWEYFAEHDYNIAKYDKKEFKNYLFLRIPSNINFKEEILTTKNVDGINIEIMDIVIVENVFPEDND